uniref:Uncharacterized protein n=1 Tax=Anguilla anguilla TaxID=7936 RepID=A0A0E9X9M3_ANGAN
MDRPENLLTSPDVPGLNRP